MPCDTQKCKAVCCRYTVLYWPIRTDEIRRYFTLHGITCISDPEGGGLILKVPLPCIALDMETYKCKIYENKPNACRVYPQKPSPFIPVEYCSQLRTNKETR